MTVKLELLDGSHKCYTNVVNYSTDNGYLTIVISNDTQDLTKLIPTAQLKHVQVE